MKSSAQNALEMARLGRLTPAEPEPFQIVDQTAICRLRRYRPPVSAPDAPALLLVPPLMLQAEIYDVEPDLSAVRVLSAAGIDTWVMDFGAPERQEGGMDRTLDDHVRAVADAVGRMCELTGRDVHLGGYSQGGMFAYQAAAYRRSEGLASIVTFGSPVDIHRFVPALGGGLAARLLEVIEPLASLPLEHIEGLPGKLTSTGFKLLTPRKEVEQLVDFVRKLHDRQALRKRESRRRFLGGEGFVAWPGPALRRFFEDIIVHNRMMSGGIVIDGRTVTLADIRCPILYFVGNRDEFAPPDSVRAIVHAAPDAEHHEVVLPAGHFGLVVGSTSLAKTWPTVVGWLRWRGGQGARPAALDEPAPQRWHDEPEEYFEVDFDYQLLSDELLSRARARVDEAVELFGGVSDTLHDLRWQLPRLARLERMTGGTRVSVAATLAAQARALPHATFFLWHGRAFTYAQADLRVDNVASGLMACGVRCGDRVGVQMRPRPSLLSAVTALNRLGAVAVLLSAELDGEPLAEALGAEPLAAFITDPEGIARCRAAYGGKLLVLGGGGGDRQLGDGVTDMEAIEPDSVAVPSWLRPNPGRARDLAMVLVSAGRSGHPKVSRISNGRWAFSALGVASAATLTPADTIYSCLPLHHPAAIMVGVGSALVSGARLALAPGFRPAELWAEVRRYGATVVFYAGEMARGLLALPASRSDRDHPVRLFAGSGMRADVWRRLTERFGVGVLEFYASTERNLVLANASGEKQGALGRPLPASAELALVRCDQAQGQPLEQGGHLQLCGADEPGLAMARVSDRVHAPEVRADVFVPGDRWYLTSDVLRRDPDGDYWFVDRLSNMVRGECGVVATPQVEDAIYQLVEIEIAAAYGLALDGGTQEQLVAVVVSRAELDPVRVSRALSTLLEHQRPRCIWRVPEIPMTEGFRPIKALLRGWGAAPAGAQQALHYDASAEAYRCA